MLAARSFGVPQLVSAAGAGTVRLRGGRNVELAFETFTAAVYLTTEANPHHFHSICRSIAARTDGAGRRLELRTAECADSTVTDLECVVWGSALSHLWANFIHCGFENQQTISISCGSTMNDLSSLKAAMASCMAPSVFRSCIMNILRGWDVLPQLQVQLREH